MINSKNNCKMYIFLKSIYHKIYNTDANYWEELLYPKEALILAYFKKGKINKRDLNFIRKVLKEKKHPFYMYWNN